MSTPITREQWAAVSQQLFPHLNYVVRLVKRMEKIGIGDDDKVLIAARKARDAMTQLSLAVHGATGRRDKQPLIPLDEVDRLAAEMSERLMANAEKQSRARVD